MTSCVKSGEGAMAAILGLSISQINDVLDNFSGGGICQIANDNDPNQVVISGHRSAVDKVIDLLKKKGARRALSLNVSAPFHCQIMAPAASKMRDALLDVTIRQPKVPVVMNTCAEAIVDPGLIRKYLVDQIVETVRWRETISYIHDQGVTTFYVLGAGKVLSGMVNRIVDSVETVNLSSSTDILDLIESKKKWVV